MCREFFITRNKFSQFSRDISNFSLLAVVINNNKLVSQGKGCRGTFSKDVEELSSNLSWNCFEMGCRGTVLSGNSLVGKLSCRETVLIPNSLDIHRYLTFLRRKYTDLPFFELKENNIQNILPFLLYFKLILNSTRDLRKKKKKK